MVHPDVFLKVKLGRFTDQPAVVVSDRTGRPFLWAVGKNHRAAMKRMALFCDQVEEDQALPRE